MNLEDFQKSWQSQDAISKISINADVLLKEVRRNQRQFRRTIFWRDVREVGVAALLMPVFIFWGYWRHDWTNYLIAAACFGIGAFILAGRWLLRKKTTDRHGTLKECIQTSLAEVSHQIWLLKNVLWWYLLPIGATVLFSVFWSECHSQKGAVEKTIDLGVSTAIVLLIYGVLYWLNQLAVKISLEPRRRELEQLLAELEL